VRGVTTLFDDELNVRDEAKVRVDHPDTSWAAARQIVPTAKSLRAQVFALLRTRGGMTDEEMQTVLRMNPSTQRPRRVELVEKHLIVDSGARRATRSGRKAIVWEPVL
jgi:hypothetical protein